jgi:peptidase E
VKATTSQRLHLVGGGPGAVRAIRAHFKAAIDELGMRRPLVAYVGVASDDNLGFEKMITTELVFTGARFKAARMASPKAPIALAKKTLHEADMIFISGGDVDQGMRLLDERGVLEDLRELCRAGKPMFGLSAGSVMLGREWVRFPDDDDARAEIFECIGAVPFHIDAHSEDDDWSELRTLLALLHKRGDKAPIGYGLTGKGGISVRLEGKALKIDALGTDIPRLVVRGGKVVHDTPLPYRPEPPPGEARPKTGKR